MISAQDMLIVILVIIFIIITAMLLFHKKSRLDNMYSGGNDEFVLEPISKQNVQAVKSIQVNKDQLIYVATPIDSLIQASFLKNWHGFAFKKDNNVIGFGSYADYEKVPGAVKIYKMIIDKNYQGMGYGKVLLKMILEKIESDDVWIDLHSENTIAKKLYLTSFDIVSDDGKTIIMKLKSKK